MSADIPSLATLRFWTVRTVATASLRLSRQIHALPAMGPATHLTLIARMPAVADTPVGKIIASLQRLYPHHYYYPADTVHVTIKNLDGPARQGTDEQALFSRIGGVVEGSRSFALKGKGLGVSPSSVFLQLYPEDQGLMELRRRLSAATGVPDRRRRDGSGLWGELARRYLFERMAFATLVRFSGSVTPAFLNEIARHGETDFGTFVIDAFELVRTDKFLSQTGTEIIARMDALPK